jgi:hypothetical protein
MRIIAEIVIDKPAAAVWKVVGDQFADAYLWASALRHSEGHGRKINNQVSDSRTCEVQGLGRTDEKLLDFDPDKFALSYEVTEGFPFFVASGVNRWRLIPEGSRTRVRTEGEIVTRGVVGLAMGPMMKMQMAGLMRRMLEDLKHYLETGLPHPRKQRASTSAAPARA